ncbi:MAG: arylesterase [Pseudomonadota bacterium]|nr:arylesterase [Pseudomonadota bacterium]
MVVNIQMINGFLGLCAGKFLTVLCSALMLVFGFIAAPDARAEPPRVLVLGDSLVAGYGLPPGQSFPEQLQRDLAAAGTEVVMINAGVSGDTTAGGLARLDWLLADNPDAVIIVLGGNDMLRGLPPEGTKANLEAMIGRLRGKGVEVLLAGMMAPRNMGADYVETFDGIYPALAAAHDIEFYPFFLDGVALDPALNLNDGLHPNRRGIAEISRRILPVVERLLARLQG